jgi:putative flippase GtrA
MCRFIIGLRLAEKRRYETGTALQFICIAYKRGMKMRFARRIAEYIRGKVPPAESIRYIVVGVLTTLINIGLSELMHVVLGIGVIVSNVVSISVSILFAYIANKLFVFRWHTDSPEALALEFCRFVGSRLFTMALELGIIFLINGILGYSARLGKLVALVFVIIVNYILSKMIVFRENSNKEAQERNK